MFGRDRPAVTLPPFLALLGAASQVNRDCHNWAEAQGDCRNEYQEDRDGQRCGQGEQATAKGKGGVI